MHVAFKILCAILAGVATTDQLIKFNRDKQCIVDHRTEPEKFKDRLEILKKRNKGWV